MINESSPLTAACLFSGMGGFSYALKKAGVRTLWANELNSHACNTYRHNHPEVELIKKDVRKLSVVEDKLTPVSILTAGFPCQSFSQAGRKSGFDDERGACFYEIPRLLKEFGDKRPSVLLLENVPNLLYGGDGMWFYEIVHQIQGAGYWFKKHSCRILNTAEMTGIPQNRPRLFMVAFSTACFPGNFYKFPEAINKIQDIADFIDRSKKQKSYLHSDNRYYKEIHKAMDKGDPKGIYQLRRYYARENKKGWCPALTANMGGGGHNKPFIKDRWGIRHLTIRECMKLQGFDAEYDFPQNVSEGEQYRQIGNAVTVPLAEILVNSIKVCFNEMRAV